MQGWLVHRQRQVKEAFVLSAASGSLRLIQGALRLIRSQWGLELGIGEFRKHALSGADYKILGINSIVVGLVVIYGAFLAKSPTLARQGGITIVAFSVLSISAGGGFIAGLVLGIIGGILALSSYPLQKAS